ncbi:MAG: hypothetical protein KDB14_03950 [Planctomycetales bacterium]|nr:hypothetical protein [Planctomycetales bacterium]
MAKFIPIAIENDRIQYLNIELIRAIHDHPDEDGVRIDFDDQHRIYLDRGKAAPLLKLLTRSSQG